jgi:hypothetical protein
MNQLLGFLTAFFVVGWAVRWYFRQANPSPKIEWQPPKEETILPSVTKWQTLEDTALVEPFAEPEIIITKTPATVETKGEVERRLEALVQEAEPEEDTLTVDSAPLQEAVETVPAEADSEPSESDADKIFGFCARCRDKREVLNPSRTQTKKGKAAIRGNCNVCGAGMFVFVSES